jgi:hypothetical protein
MSVADRLGRAGVPERVAHHPLAAVVEPALTRARRIAHRTPFAFHGFPRVSKNTRPAGDGSAALAVQVLQQPQHLRSSGIAAP